MADTTAVRTGLALSIQQPWAWLIVNGFKDVENRGWSTRVRGVVGVHAGKKIDSYAIPWIRREFPHIPLPDTFETGGIVGRVRIVDCVDDHPSPWFFGNFAFVLSDAEPLPFVPCRGKLGFFRPVIQKEDGNG